MTEADGGRIGRAQQSTTMADKTLTNLLNSPAKVTRADVLPPLSPFLLEHIKVQDNLNLKARGLSA